MKVVVYPDPALRAVARAVIAFDGALKSLIDDMAEAMYAATGVGLAAPQVGVLSRLVLVDPSAGDDGNALVAMVNPRLVWASPDVVLAEEGCLSLPGVFVKVSRSQACDVEYVDVGGVQRSLRCVGMQARIVQHEVEHLDGVLMLHKVGPLARRLALKELDTLRGRTQERQNEDVT